MKVWIFKTSHDYSRFCVGRDGPVIGRGTNDLWLVCTSVRSFPPFFCLRTNTKKGTLIYYIYSAVTSPLNRERGWGGDGGRVGRGRGGEREGGERGRMREREGGWGEREDGEGGEGRGGEGRGGEGRGREGRGGEGRGGEGRDDCYTYCNRYVH